MIWSSLRSITQRFTSGSATKNLSAIITRQMSEHKTMNITASRWQWRKFKDILHYYVLVGAIPVGAIVFYANVFIGPAQLAPIPEGYTPKHWEYYSHPITRWMARYVLPNPQQEYEKYLHYVYEEDEKMKMRALEKKVLEKMAERNDYQAFYYKPISGKQHRIVRKQADALSDTVGIARMDD